MTLDAQIVVQAGALQLDVALQARPERVVGVLGPNGAGKTTLLRALAGLIPLQSGRIALDDVVLDDVHTRRHVEPERRGVGLMFQSARLFGHLSVADNVAFGLRATGVPRGDARKRADELLERVGLAGYGRRRPNRLSGGEAQRVALARALAVEPKLLLLDEPLAAVDALARIELQGLLRRELSRPGAAAIVVTHDPGDASAIADDLIVIECGRVVQAGTLSAVVARPQSRWLATMLGVNLLTVGEIAASVGGAMLPRGWRDVPGSHLAMFPPGAVALSREPAAPGSPLAWQGIVDGVRQAAGMARATVLVDRSEIVLDAQVGLAESARLGLRDGGSVWASVRVDDVNVYPPDQAVMPTSSGTAATDSAVSRSITP